MVLVSGCDFSLEDELLDVSTSVLPVLPVTILFEQSQQPSRVEESSQPVRRHPLPSLQSKKTSGFLYSSYMFLFNDAEYSLKIKEI